MTPRKPLQFSLLALLGAVAVAAVVFVAIVDMVMAGLMGATLVVSVAMYQTGHRQPSGCAGVAVLFAIYLVIVAWACLIATRT